MSLQSFFQKFDNDVAKVAPLVDLVLPMVAAISPSATATVSVVEGVVRGAAAVGVQLENDIEALWAVLQPAVTSLAKPTPTAAPSASA